MAKNAKNWIIKAFTFKLTLPKIFISAKVKIMMRVLNLENMCVLSFFIEDFCY